MRVAALVLSSLVLFSLPSTSANGAEVSATFSALGSGASASSGFADVRALAYAPDGTLYAGGDFDVMGGVTVNGIAQWNGSSWSALGAGTNGSVLALAFDSSGNLYVGGDFTLAGGITARGIARWNGSSWSTVGTTGTNGPVFDLEFIGTDLYAGGNFTTADGNSANYIAKWNGTVWSALGAGTNSLVRSLESDDSGNLYVGGDFNSADGNPASRVAQWNGTAWSALGTGTNGSVYTVAVIDNVLYVGGNFNQAGGASAGSVAAWVPAISSWNVPANSGVNYVVHSIAPQPDGSIIAGGAFTETSSGEQLLRLGRWDGTSWSQMGTGVPGTYAVQYVGVIANAPDGSIVIGGKFSEAGGIAAANIARVQLIQSAPSSPSSPGGMMVQGVHLNAQGNCDSIDDAAFAYGTGLTGGWRRAWQVWITDSAGNRVGGWGCSRTFRHNGNTWFIEGQ